MAVKYYAQIDFDLFSDPRFRALSSNDVRFIYLTAQCSKLSNYIGLFRYPVEVWSYDANVKPLEVEAAIEELSACGLVDYDFEQQVLRLIGWFYSLYAPENGNQMKGHIKSFQGMSFCPAEMYCQAVSEFTVSSFVQTLQWDELSPEHRKVTQAFRAFLKATFFRYGDSFIDVLLDEVNRSGKSVYGVIQSCFQLLPDDGLEVVKPFRRGSETVLKQERTVDESKINQKNLDLDRRASKQNQPQPLATTVNSRIARDARNGRF